MAITIGRYAFDGPYDSAEFLEDRSGVYAVLDRRIDGYWVLDVGESAQVKTRVVTHERRACWSFHGRRPLYYAALYTPGVHQAGRMQIEVEIRGQYKPPCGER